VGGKKKTPESFSYIAVGPKHCCLAAGGESGIKLGIGRDYAQCEDNVDEAVPEDRFERRDGIGGALVATGHPQVPCAGIVRQRNRDPAVWVFALFDFHQSCRLVCRLKTPLFYIYPLLRVLVRG
jgi:hypothetical protein